MANPLLDPAVDETLKLAFRVVTPEAALIGTVCLLMLVGTVTRNRAVPLVLALAGLGTAILLHFLVPTPTELIPTVTPFLPDAFAAFVRLTALFGGVVLVLLGQSESGEKYPSEYLACLLTAIAGLSLTGSANDLLTIFLALEMISIPTYVLLYIPRDTAQSRESAVKYFLLSVLSSGFLLFGFSYLYGISGTLNLTAILALAPELMIGPSSVLMLVALVMIIAGLGFRVTAVPFHFYAPDVYQGGPTGVVGFLAFVPKVAGFALLFRMLVGTGITDQLPFSGQLPTLIWILAAVTMTFGNILALLQDNLKRLLAYSSIAHGGYMLIGLAVAINPETHEAGSGLLFRGGEAVLFYLIAYGAMTLGAFAILGHLNSPERPVETIDDLAGLHEGRPWLAAAMALFLFSLIGLPLTGGFAGKFLLFASAISAAEGPYQAMFYLLVVIAAINAAVAAYYYLRIIGIIYQRPMFQPFTAARSPATLATVILCVIATVGLGLYPWPLIEAANVASAVPDPIALLVTDATP